MNAIDLIREERARQDARYGGPQHDDEHHDCSLTIAGAKYALDSVPASSPHHEAALGASTAISSISPCGHSPADQLRNLTKAAAVLAAEMERVMRQLHGVEGS